MLPDLHRPMRRAALALALSASILSPARAALAQTDEEKAAARALATQGAEELKQNHYAQAFDLVTRAEQIFHAPPHLLMIARAQIGLGKLVGAQETLLKLIREDLPATAPAAFKNAQASGKEELAQIEPKIGQLRIVLDGPGQAKATVKLDDKQVPQALLGVYRPIDPGPHVVTVFPMGGSPIKGAIDVHEAEKKDLKLTVPDAPGPGVPLNPADNPDQVKTPPDAGQGQRDTAGGGFFSPLRGAGIGIGAAGLVGVVVGAIFVAKGGSTQSQADSKAIADGCSASNTSDCRGLTFTQRQDITNNVIPLDNTAASQKTIGVVGLSIGGAALVTGVVLLVVGKPKPATGSAAPGSAPRASVTPWFTGTAGGLQGTF